MILQVAACTDGPAAAAVESTFRLFESDGDAHQLASSGWRQRTASITTASDAQGLYAFPQLSSSFTFYFLIAKVL